ncbi:MAG TPA: immunoglobulin domain-containing protein [Verrucomicrobiae bacterium]
MKGSFAQRRAWWLAAMFLACLCRPVCAQLITNFNGFSGIPYNKTSASASFLVITNFQTNAFIGLQGDQTFKINRNVLIDGSTNGVVFDGGGTLRIFTVATNVTLILNNLQILNGNSTNGGAIYNNGTVIISNCIISGNAVTNITGVGGTTNSGSGDGGNASSGGSAFGGAIYSRGPFLGIYNSVLGTNSAIAGNGGSGGSGGNSLLFGGNGGNSGSGGSAFGAAVYSVSRTNVFSFTEFFDNTCTAGSAGNGGPSGSGAFGGIGGKGSPGGTAAGGAVYLTGRVFITNCVFSGNSVTAGTAGGDLSGNNEGFSGGSAEGGGLFLPAAITNAYIENSIFFNNSCKAGSGGSTSADLKGGNGGSALGGGLASAALLATLRNCTLASNTLAAGTNGPGGEASGNNGSIGGWDLARAGGVVKLSGSIISGGTNSTENPRPNADGITDGAFNISSDASLTAVTTNTLINNSNVLLDTLVSGFGSVMVGPTNVDGPPMETIDLQDGSIAAGFVTGVPGLSFPATDELGAPRGTPTSAGAFAFEFWNGSFSLDTNLTASDIVLDPMLPGQTTRLGGTVTFTVSAALQDTNSGGLGYQWQLNNTNLTDNTIFFGVTTPTLTVKNVTAAQASSNYQVVVSPSLLEAAVTSAPVFLAISAGAPAITAEPASKLNVDPGATVSFSVTAKAPAGLPLSYQWYFGAVPLSDGINVDDSIISGSSTRQLTILSASTNEAGGYFVQVTDTNGTDSSDLASLTFSTNPPPPAVAITSPAPAARTTNLIIQGTASSPGQIVAVDYFITNIDDGATNFIMDTASLSAGTGAVSNWTIFPTGLFGTNYVTVQSVDFSGNVSKLVTREFFYIETAQLKLATNGFGGITAGPAVLGSPPPTNGALLAVNQGYTLTAKAASRNVFSNWTFSTGLATNANPLHFIMQGNLSITANFSTNLFVAAAARYDGIFQPSSPEAPSTTNSGLVNNLMLQSNGIYSGKLYLSGASYPLSGTFNAGGSAAETITRTAAAGGNVILQMTVSGQNTNRQITGEAQGNGWEAGNLSLFPAMTAAHDSPAYTVLLTNSSLPDGYALATNITGMIHMGGALPDGTPFTALLEPVNELNQFPVYASLPNKSLLLGELSLDASANPAVPAGSLNWVRPGETRTAPDEFDVTLGAEGSPWTNSAAAVESLFQGDAQLTFSGGGLDSNLACDVEFTATDAMKLVSGSPNFVSGSINRVNGLMTISFINTSGKKVTASGALLQNTAAGGGFFPGTTNAGSVTLTRPPP